MGLSSKKTKTSSTSSGTATTTPQAPSWLQGPYQNLFSQVAGMAGGPTPGAAPLQTQGFAGAGGLNTDASRALLNYTPGTVTPGQIAGTDLSPYMNPYTSSVIDASLADLDRARRMAISGDQGAATMAHAYGGSRHGVVDSETNRNFIDQAGGLASQLRALGFTGAQDAAKFDIGARMGADQFNSQQGLAGAQFRLGAANQAEQGDRTNAVTQAALGEQQRDTTDPVQSRLRYLSQILASLGVNPAAFIGQNITQSGQSSGTTKQSGGFTFGWSPSGGLQVGYG